MCLLLVRKIGRGYKKERQSRLPDIPPDAAGMQIKKDSRSHAVDKLTPRTLPSAVLRMVLSFCALLTAHALAYAPAAHVLRHHSPGPLALARPRPSPAMVLLRRRAFGESFVGRLWSHANADRYRQSSRPWTAQFHSTRSIWLSSLKTLRHSEVRRRVPALPARHPRDSLHESLPTRPRPNRTGSERHPAAAAAHDDCVSRCRAL